MVIRWESWGCEGGDTAERRFRISVSCLSCGCCKLDMVGCLVCLLAGPGCSADGDEMEPLPIWSRQGRPLFDDGRLVR